MDTKIKKGRILFGIVQAGVLVQYIKTIANCQKDLLLVFEKYIKTVGIGMVEFEETKYTKFSEK